MFTKVNCYVYMLIVLLTVTYLSIVIYLFYLKVTYLLHKGFFKKRESESDWEVKVE